MISSKLKATVKLKLRQVRLLMMLLALITFLTVLTMLPLAVLAMLLPGTLLLSLIFPQTVDQIQGLSHCLRLGHSRFQRGSAFVPVGPWLVGLPVLLGLL